jgi:hypothetical protein
MPRASAGALRVEDEPRPRRTVTITGRPEKHIAPPPRIHRVAAPAVPAVPSVRQARIVEIDRRRPRARTSDRLGPRPDKVAMWAVLMAVFLILVTLVSSHAGG